MGNPTLIWNVSHSYISGILFLYIFFHFSPDTFSQNKDLDSLWNAYHQASNDSIRLTTLSEISWKYLRVNPSRARSVADQVMHEGDSLGYDKQEAVAMNYTALTYYLEGNNEAAIDMFEKSHERAIELTDTITIAATINNLGLVFIKMGAFELAFENFQKGVDLAEEYGDEKNLCTGWSNMGSTLQLMEEYEKAIPYFEKSIELGKKIKNLATVYNSYFHLGEIAVKRGNLDIAKTYFEESMQGYIAEGDPYGKANAFIHLGQIARLENKFSVAHSHLDSALALTHSLNFIESIDKAYNEKAHLLLEEGNYQEAIKICQQVQTNESISISNQYLLADFYWIEAQCLAQLGNYKKAYEVYVNHHALHDTLFNKDKLKIISNLEIRYQSAKKEIENKLLKDQQRKNEIAIVQRNIIIVGTGIILILSMVLAFILFNNYQQKKENNRLLEEEVDRRTQELQESNDNLARFAFITSHDLKEPIRNITSFTQLIEKRVQTQYGENEELQEFAEYVVRNAKQMYTLVDDVQTFTMLEKQSKELTSFPLSSVIRRVEDALNQKIFQTKTQIVYEGDLELNSNASLVFLVLKNLIENAIKYNESDPPIIHIDHQKTELGSRITIKDNGIGIPEKYRTKVFEMFSRLHDRKKYSGSGLGLSICKKIVSQLGGEIWVEGEEGKGSTFYVSLPESGELV
ncbi:MAG: tetratricopeptide repeat protein [Bacteroidota bacterium]